MEEEKNPHVIHPSGTAMTGHPTFHRPHEETVQHEKPESKKGTWTEKIFDMVITVSLVALFFGLPIFFTGFTLQGIALEKQVYFYFWLLLGLVAWASKGVITGDLRIRRTPLDIPILLFVVFYGLDIFFSVDKWHSFFGFFGDPSRGFLSVLGLALAYFLLLSHFTWKRFLLMFGGFVVSGMIVILWSVLVLMNVHFLPTALAAYAPMSLIGTVSTLATFLSLLVPIFLTALFGLSRMDAKRKWLRGTGIGAIGVFLIIDLFLLLGLFPFVPWPVLFGGMGFFILFILAQVVRPGDQWTWAPMLVFVLVLVFFMIGSNKLLRANLPVEVSPNVTLSWDIAKGALKDNFIFGTGPANYGYAFSMYRPIEYNQSSLYSLRFYEGKGLFFEALSSIGALGTLLLLVLWLSFISLGIYLLAFEKHRNKIYSLGLWTVAAMLLIAGFFSAMNGPLVLIGALLSMLALAVLFHESATEERYWSFSLKASPKFALTLAFIFMVVSAGVAFLFVFVGKVFVADLKAGMAARAAEPSENTRALLISAVQLYPNEGRYLTRLAQEQLALANMEAKKPEKERKVEAIAFYTHEAAAAAEAGWMKSPQDALTTESTGQVFENASLFASDALPKAFEYYEKASRLEPNNPLLLLKMGQVKKAMADQKQDGVERTALFDEAKGFFLASIEKKKNLAVTHYFLALVASGLKDFDQSVSEMTEASRLEPTNTNYSYNLGVVYQIRGKDADLSKAEDIFKSILGKNERLVDVRLSLGLLYEKEGDMAAAIGEYEKTLEYLKDDATSNLRDQVNKLIANAKSGKGNIAKPNNTLQQAAPAAETAAPAPAPTATPVIGQ
jgi:tetratricopeptide (TPR) repeat protein